MRLKTVSVMAIAMAAGLALAACQPAAAPKTEEPKAVAATAPTPPAGWETAFPNCTWGEVKGGGVSMFAFACPNDKIVYDAALPGFVREMSGENAAKGLAVQFITKAADATIEQALPAIKAASKGGEACVLEQIKDAPAGEFQLVPTGAALKAYNDFIEGKANAGPGMPCGPLGQSEAGMRIIRAVPGAPTLVAIVHMPSEIAIFDAKTLKGAP